MQSAKCKILYENEDVLVIDKPAGIVVFPEGKTKEKTLIDYLLEKCPDLKNAGQPPRYGIVHRLDKETSGILLVAKNNKTLDFLQREFKERKVEKKYLTLVTGYIKNNDGLIETLIGRNPKNKKKQKAYLSLEPCLSKSNKRMAITEYRVLDRFSFNKEKYTLLEVSPKTGRKHQIRVHLAHLGHPVVGDKIYDFKNQPQPKGLNRHFLHASYIRIKFSSGEEKEFLSELPEELEKIIEDLKK